MFATYFRMSEKSFAPKRCDTGIVKPLHTPMTNPIIKKFTAPVEPTAASA